MTYVTNTQLCPENFTSRNVSENTFTRMLSNIFYKDRNSMCLTKRKQENKP
jgi:hypothetical protein